MSITYIGSTFSVTASTPTTEDAAGYAALTYTEVGKVITIGELGDTSEDVTVNHLKDGRTVHINGVKDLGEVAVEIEFDGSDAGQQLIANANNTNTTHSFQIVDADGHTVYFQGLVANLRHTQRASSNYKGASFVVRGQTGLTETGGW